LQQVGQVKLSRQKKDARADRCLAARRFAVVAGSVWASRFSGTSHPIASRQCCRTGLNGSTLCISDTSRKFDDSNLSERPGAVKKNIKLFFNDQRKPLYNKALRAEKKLEKRS
jgi:hypothetical protein